LNGIYENAFGDEFDEPTNLQITETFQEIINLTSNYDMEQANSGNSSVRYG